MLMTIYYYFFCNSISRLFQFDKESYLLLICLIPRKLNALRIFADITGEKRPNGKRGTFTGPARASSRAPTTSQAIGVEIIVRARKMGKLTKQSG